MEAFHWPHVPGGRVTPPPCEGSLKTHVGLVNAAPTCGLRVTLADVFFIEGEAVVTDFCFGPNVHFGRLAFWFLQKRYKPKSQVHGDNITDQTRHDGKLILDGV